MGTIIIPSLDIGTAEAGLARGLSIVSKHVCVLINLASCSYSDEFRVAPILYEFRLFEDVPVLPNGPSDLLHQTNGFPYI